MKIKICFTGGGTAGHVFPGISVLEKIEEKSKKGDFETDYLWIGSSSGMEKRLLADSGIKYYGIQTGKLRRYFSLQNFTDLFKIAAGLFQSFFILLKEKPDIVFSKGGYVSVPPVISGWMLRIPVITHESDYSPGLATRINSRFSEKILISIDDTEKYFKPEYKKKLSVTGNPVRKKFFTGNAEKGKEYFGISNNLPVILVLGGSQGASEINNLIRSILDKLTENFNVIHQCGERDYNPDFGKDNKNYYQVPFVRDEFPDILASADLVVSRGGAGTIWELSAAGKAAVIIPLRGSGTRGDQVLNCSFLKAIDAASVLDNKVISEDMLYNQIKSIFENRETIVKYTENIKAITKKDPAEKISDIIIKKCRR